MSALGNGDGSSGNGDPPEGLPDLPPEWGTIVVPDDASELAAEAAALRRELRRQRRRGASRTRDGPAVAPGALTALRVPLLIMAAAILATLTSLFVVTWPTQRQPVVQRTASGGGPSSRTLPALDLIDASGAVVPLRGLLPAVIVLTKGCTCAAELASAVSAAPPGVAVVEVTTGRSALGPAPDRPAGVASAVHRLADPTSELQALIPATPPAGTAAALLIGRSGEIVLILPSVTMVQDHRTELVQLAYR